MRYSPEPPLPQAEQPLRSQPLLTGEVLQALHHLGGPVLDPSQYVQVSLALACPELDSALQAWPHQYRAERQEHLSQPAGNTLTNEAKNAISLLSSKGTLLTHVQLGVYQDSYVFFCNFPSLLAVYKTSGLTAYSKHRKQAQAKTTCSQ